MYTGHEKNIEVLNAVAQQGFDLRATGWLAVRGPLRGVGTVVHRIDGIPLWFFVRQGEAVASVIKHLEYRAGPVEKNWHRWQKDLPSTQDLVKSLVKPGALIVDPCCGGGTTGEAALRHGCRFIGIDVDPNAIEVTRKRLTAVEEELSAKQNPKKGGGA
jgi:2-polyprenyl-3-methyl-5-hydroxy-6-metoxy-1,4-benzoquinol methylase